MGFCGDHQYPPFFQFAHQKSNSDSINAIGNYSGVDTFIVAPPEPTASIVITRLIVTISDAGVFQTNYYGGISGGLDSGITIQVNRDSTMKYTITNGVPVTSNFKWEAFGSVEFEDFGAGDDHAQVILEFHDAGQNILLDGSQNDTLMVIFKDDLTGLTGHHFQFQGYNKSKAP